jgi:hypothetical protein
MRKIPLMLIPISAAVAASFPLASPAGARTPVDGSRAGRGMSLPAGAAEPAAAAVAVVRQTAIAWKSCGRQWDPHAGLRRGQPDLRADGPGLTDTRHGA